MATVDLTDWCRNLTPRKIEQVIKKIAFELDASVVRMSPVGNPDLWVTLKNGQYADYVSVHGYPDDYTGGRFRANWQVGINTKPTGETGEIDQTVAATLGKGLAVLGGYRMGDTIYILNNVPYAERLENGWSTQAPVGMVGVTVARFESIVRQAAIT